MSFDALAFLNRLQHRPEHRTRINGLEFRVGILRKIWPKQAIVLSKFLNGARGFASNDSIDTSDFVRNLMNLQERKGGGKFNMIGEAVQRR